MNNKPSVTIYTDGGADPNPGPGGWAAILIHDATGRVREMAGGEPDTTNNRMELWAAIQALAALKQPCTVRLVTDSEYLQRGITRHIGDWMAKGFKRVKNADLWQRLVETMTGHDVAWEWVKGHTGNRWNERADALATQQIRILRGEERAPGAPPDAEITLIVSAQPALKAWAALVRHAGSEHLMVGYEEEATSNQLDILAAREALRSLPDGIAVQVSSMSDYLRNGASQWIKAWKKRGWLTKGGEPVKNRELWEALEAELEVREVTWPAVKDDPAYEAVFEELARRAQEEFEEMYGAPGGQAAPDSADPVSRDLFADDLE